MTPVTHGLLPLLLAHRRLPRTGDRPAGLASGLVAGFGVLPDLLCPHLDILARHAAWSHSLAGGLGLGLLAWPCARWALGPTSPWQRVGTCAALATISHVGLDLVTGGVPLFLPVSTRVVGAHYVPFWLWIASDTACVLGVYLIYRAFPRLRSAKRSHAAR